MDTTAIVVIAIVIAIVVILVVFLLRDRLSELSVNGKEAKMEVKAKAPENNSTQDDKPVSVEFTGNTLRGEGEYRMRNSKFSDNNVGGKNKLELGYDEAASDAQHKENQ